MGNIDKAVAECNKVTGEHERLMNEKNDLVLALQSGGSAVQDIIDKTNRIEAMKNDVEKQLKDTMARVKAEEEQKSIIGQQASKVKSEADKLRADIKTLEAQMESCEEDKSTKDSQIRTLKEEIGHQEELISRLQKEKRSIGDSRQKTERTSKQWRTSAIT